MRTTVPHPRPAPRERSRPASFCPAPVASAFAPPAPVSAAPAVPPSPPLLPSSSSLSRTPDKVRVRTVRAAVPHPRPARRERSLRHLSVRPSPLRLPALAAPQLRPFRRPLRFCPRLPASPARRTKFGSVLCVLPFRIPARHAGNGPSGIFLSGLRPYGSRPLPLPSSGRSAVPSASALVFQPLPHAGQSSGPYCARCRSASPPGTPGTVPSDIFLPGLRPSGSRFRRSAVFALSRRGSAPPRGDRPNRLLLRPGTRKGLSDRSQTAPFLSVCYSGTSPNTQFSENWKNSSDGPLHSYSRSRTSPPPPNMPLKGSKNLPDSSVRSRIAQPADRLPAPAAAGLSSSSHRSSGSPDR